MHRIRTLKPEWLSDEVTGGSEDASRVLSAGLILLADDYGRGRIHPSYIAGQVWQYASTFPETLRKVSGAILELFRKGYFRPYFVRGQAYYQLTNWNRHQKVQKPGAPRVPVPSQPSDYMDEKVFPEWLRKVSGISPEVLRTDLDQDQDQDQDRECEGSDFVTAKKTQLEKKPRTKKPDADLIAQNLRTIAELESRYAPDLAKRIRTVLGLARKKSKRISDGAWLHVLRQLETHPVQAVEQAMREFIGKHPDGSQRENYLLGFVRNTVARGGGNGAAPPAQHHEFANDDVDEVWERYHATHGGSHG